MHRKQIGLALVLVVALSFAGTAIAQAKKAAPAAPAQKTALIDLNSATKEQLMTLQGVGDVTAQKIIDNRPYRAKNQLVQKKIVSQSVYDKISSQIIAKQPAAATPAKKKGGK